MVDIPKHIDDITPYKGGKPIEELKRQLKLKTVYKLASNENPFTPSHLSAAINKELKNIHRYPESNCFYLRQELAKRMKVKPGQIMFGNGSDELIVLALKVFLQKGDEVIIGRKTFLIYELQAKIHQLKVKYAEFNNFKLDYRDILSKINKKTKMIFIANPDNPRGTYLNKKEVDKLLSKVPSNVIVYFDEAYYEFCPKKDFPRVISYLKRGRGNIIFSRTFSKIYGLAGLRVGYAIADKKVAEAINKIREPFNVNRLAQAAALAALRHPEFIKRVSEHVKQEKEYLYRQLDSLGVFYVKSAANFIFFDIGKDAGLLYNFLLKRGLIIRSLKQWGFPTSLRVTIGKHKENVYFIKQLKEFLKSSN